MPNFSEELKQEAFDFAFAVYRVTELFPKEEPLRKELREYSAGLLAKISGVEIAETSEKSALLRNILVSLEALKSLFFLSHKTGLMKAINAEVLERERTALEIYFQHETRLKAASEMPRAKVNKAQNDAGVINPALKNGMSFLHQNGKKLKIQDFISLGRYRNSDEMIGAMPFSSDEVNDISQKHAIKTTLTAKSVSLSAGGETNPDGINERQGAIIDYLGANKEVKMTDLVTIFSNRFSIKTLQRDLARLIASGAVEKEGDKRWSVYRLASL